DPGRARHSDRRLPTRPSRKSPSPLERRRVEQRRILAAHRIDDRILDRTHALPFGGWPGRAVAADLIDPPIDFETVPIGVAEFDRDLAAGTPPTFEIDQHLAAAQMVSRPHHLVERRDLE